MNIMHKYDKLIQEKAMCVNKGKLDPSCPKKSHVNCARVIWVESVIEFIKNFEKQINRDE